MFDDDGDAPSDAFADLPYTVLFGVLSYVPGVRALAALMGTCKRAYEIGSESDALWEIQLRGFFPHLLAKTKNSIDSQFFVGHYFILRTHVSKKKTEALMRFVGEACSSGDDARFDSSLGRADWEMWSVLGTTASLSLRGGVCLGPRAGLLLRRFPRPSLLLDTLDLTGMLIECSGLEHIAEAASAAKLPFLKTLGLRQNKLAGSDQNCKRSGKALALILNSCTGLQCLDLSGNRVAGIDGVGAIFCCGDNNNNKTSTRLPAKLWLDNNPLGTKGAAVVAEMMANQVAVGSSGGTLPTMLSLRETGIGLDHVSANANAVHDSSRSPIADCQSLVTAIHSLMMGFHIAGAAKLTAYAKDVREKNERQAARRNKNKMMAAVDNKDLARLIKYQAVCFTLQLGSEDTASQMSSPTLTPAARAAAAAKAKTQPSHNALPVGLLEREAVEKSGLHFFCDNSALHSSTKSKAPPLEASAIRSSFTGNDTPGLCGELLTEYSHDVTFIIEWPDFDGENPSSSCVIA